LISEKKKEEKRDLKKKLLKCPAKLKGKDLEGGT